MFKSATYILLLISAGALIVLTTLSIPLIFEEEQREDLRNDLGRAWGGTQAQFRLMAYDQVAAAERSANDEKLALIFVDAWAAAGANEPVEGAVAEAPEPTPSASRADAVSADLARAYRQDLVLVLTRKGEVLSSSHDQGPKRGEDLSGLPPVRDALQGLRRDWIWAAPGGVMLTAASPILVSRGSTREVAGVVLVGERMDSARASEITSRVEPVRHNNSTLGLAFVHKGDKLGSSIKDAELQALISRAAGGYSSTDLPYLKAEDAAAQIRVEGPDDQKVAYLTSALSDDDEGKDFGVVLLLSRKSTGSGLIDLAVASHYLEVAPGQGPPTMVVFAIAVVLFLLGLLLISSEIAAPARKLIAELTRIEGHIEEGEVRSKNFRGINFRVARQINTILTGLRKRLERERQNAQESLVPADAIEALPAQPWPSTGATEAPSRHVSGQKRDQKPQGLPFSDSKEIKLPVEASEKRMPTGQFDLIEKSAPKRIQLDDDEVKPHLSPFLTREDSVDQAAAADDDDDAAHLRELVALDDDAQGEGKGEALDLAEVEAEPFEQRDEAAAAFNDVHSGAPALDDSDLDQDPADAHSMEQVAESLADELVASLSSDGLFDEQDAAEEADEDDAEDATVDVSSAQLQDLIAAVGVTSSLKPRSLKTGTEAATLVDNLGVVRSLARNTAESNEPEELDALSSSAIVASPPPPPPRKPFSKEVSTAEVNRGDEAFQAALAASARGGNAAQGPFGAEPSQLKPIPSTLAPPQRNPVVHQAPTTPGTAPKPAAETIDPDQQYFEKLYQQFVKTKEECDEPTDGLTLDKFVKRLHKNKAQLMERYNCRSVRFQVHVKNGQAALKATPIK